MQPTHTAIGTWSGGRYMRFGEEIEAERLVSLLTPGGGVDTVISADTYGQGEADSLLATALTGLPREDYALVGAVGHDFYEGERDGPKGFPRFTDPSLRDEDGYRDYLQMAADRSLERLGVSDLDLLLLHNPDRTGYTSEAVWEAMAELRADGHARAIGVAPGPANGFTLDLLDCFDRFGDILDWAMIILNPFEPWPGELVLDAAAEKHIRLITRVVDYGGLFWGDVRPGHAFAEHDHRKFRPEGWVEAGCEKLDRLAPILDDAGLEPIQLAAEWNLAHPSVSCVVPTLIQEIEQATGVEPLPIELKREQLAAVSADPRLSAGQVEEIRKIGDNSGCMALKGASPEHEGEVRPDRWPLAPEHTEIAARWGIEPERDLVKTQG